MTQQLYNPLSGPELKELILKKCNTILDNSGKFDAHISWPNCQFYINIQVHLPVTKDRDFTLQAKVEEQQLPPDVETETLNLVGSTIESGENPPDKIRDDNQMPVSIPEVKVSKGGIVEVIEKKEIRTKAQELANKLG